MLTSKDRGLFQDVQTARDSDTCVTLDVHLSNSLFAENKLLMLVILVEGNFSISWTHIRHLPPIIVYRVRLLLASSILIWCQHFCIGAKQSYA